MKRILATLASSLIFSFMTPSVHAQQVIDNNGFLNQYQEIVDSLVESYHLGVKEPLNAHIFDIAVPGYYNFLARSTHGSYEDELMAMQYYSDFKVSGEQTAFCFILYNSNKHLLEGYVKASSFQWDHLVEYLAAHEMGHCFVAHQRTLGHTGPAPTRNDEEKIADSFAIAYFLYLNQEEDAQKIIQNESRLPPNDIHYNSASLQKFLEAYKQQNFHPHNVYEIFQDSYKVYQSLLTTPMMPNPLMPVINVRN
jgi:hypothetical protein